MSRAYLLVGSLLLVCFSANATNRHGAFYPIPQSTTNGGGIAFCCEDRLRSSSTEVTGFRGTGCRVIANTPRSINACLNGGFGGPGDISAGCLSGVWSCEPFVDTNGNVVKNCCCEPLEGQGNGTCLNDPANN